MWQFSIVSNIVTSVSSKQCTRYFIQPTDQCFLSHMFAIPGLFAVFLDFTWFALQASFLILLECALFS